MPPPVPREPESTAELLRRSFEGDKIAVEDLCARLRPALKRWASGRLPRWARAGVDTEDLVQNALTRSLVERRGIEARPGVRAYLRMIILNEIRDRVSAALVAKRIVLPPRPPDPSPLEELLGRERLERFDAALARLSPEDRTAVVCRIEMGMPYKEIADELGRPSADAARMAVARALVRLSRELADGT
jgi:RNA polymerase sigma factor, sigma-70 family